MYLLLGFRPFIYMKKFCQVILSPYTWGKPPRKVCLLHRHGKGVTFSRLFFVTGCKRWPKKPFQFKDDLVFGYKTDETCFLEPESSGSLRGTRAPRPQEMRTMQLTDRDSSLNEGCCGGRPQHYLLSFSMYNRSGCSRFAMLKIITW